ncbi:MAG: D-tyrosyl-tRNA(Tyr) deacylase [Planctomycetota bacterium]|jgi:D-tyrosyl-tRNA(Tyr) deacylase
MKAVIQRVCEGSVLVKGEVVGRVGAGMVVLLGVLKGDTALQAERLAKRIALFRFFPDEKGRMNLSAVDNGLGALVVSQFTLAADGRKGRRPSFDRAADPSLAEPLYEEFVAQLASHGIPCETGRFGAEMRVALVGDGPVTFVLEEESTPERETAK